MKGDVGPSLTETPNWALGSRNEYGGVGLVIGAIGSSNCGRRRIDPKHGVVMLSMSSFEHGVTRNFLNSSSNK
jgi:hypothetical protein